MLSLLFIISAYCQKFFLIFIILLGNLYNLGSITWKNNYCFWKFTILIHLSSVGSKEVCILSRMTSVSKVSFTLIRAVLTGLGRRIYYYLFTTNLKFKNSNWASVSQPLQMQNNCKSDFINCLWNSGSLFGVPMSAFILNYYLSKIKFKYSHVPIINCCLRLIIWNVRNQITEITIL